MLLTTLSLGLAATSLGMLVAAVSKTERQADSIGMVQAFVLAGLGGCIVIGAVPLYQAGGVLGALSNLTPHAHALMAYSDLMVKGATAIQVLPQVGLLLAFAAGFFTIATWRFRYD
jgi:ABC-2 type transport system permease protein